MGWGIKKPMHEAIYEETGRHHIRNMGLLHPMEPVGFNSGIDNHQGYRAGSKEIAGCQMSKRFRTEGGRHIPLVAGSIHGFAKAGTGCCSTSSKCQNPYICNLSVDGVHRRSVCFEP